MTPLKSGVNMVLMKKYQFTLDYFKQNFKYKNFCEALDNALINKIDFSLFPVDAMIVHHAVFDNVGTYGPVKIDENYKETDWDKYFEKVENEFFNNKKNKKFKDWFLKQLDSGLLLTVLNNNFKLIHNLDVGNQHYSLIYSKFNKKYYFFESVDEFYIIRNSFNKEPSKENIITIIKKILKDIDSKIELSLFEEDFNNFLNNRIE